MNRKWQYKPFKSNLQRFIEKTEVNPFTECFIWIGKVDKRGYGYLSINNNSTLAHIFSYKLFKGNISNNMEIDHLCSNKSCVNPEHLEAVSHSINIKRHFLRNPITHCKKHHELNKENTYVRKNGKRECRLCRNIREKNNQIL